jgi:Kef-type K+ transport system membrane component KefB/nucleotide-binding universal stress UspA family protein
MTSSTALATLVGIMSQVPALPGHALALVLVQITIILALSRLCAEAVKRLGQPAVLGELMAGILLGPSLFGALWPGGFAALFPAESTQVHLLEMVAWIGMVLLLLLTGLETDVRLLRHLGRSALASSLLGMVVPLIAGFWLGLWMPDRFLAAPDRRLLFSVFLATAMSISAMPVIAKILFDLELTKRNIGVVILSAGVVDDTTGWLILSLIAGIAGATSNVLPLFILRVVLTLAFLVACRFVFYPVARWLVRIVDDHARTPHADLPLIVGFAFLLAAATEAIGIHAVFGAFVAGCLLRQVPRLRAASLHRLEAVAVSIFAPVFFGLVGLKVDLRTVGSTKMLLVVIGVATAGKLIGCTVGGLIGKMTFWESLSTGVAMNARGAMGLVVALIGLDLGILGTAMYAIIVVMAIVTSFLAPLLLRLTLPRVKMTAEEQARIAAESQRGLFDQARLKALIPTTGGPNALVAGRLATALVRGDAAALTLLFVQSETGLLARIGRLFRHDQAGKSVQDHLEALRTFAAEQQVRVEVRKTTEADPVGYIVKEASHGFDLMLVGAAQRNPLRSSVTTALLERAPCHMAIVRGHGAPAECKHLLVATSGSFFSQAAVELAILYAEQAHAAVTVLYSMEAEGDSTDDDGASATLEEGFHRMMATTVLTTLSPLLTRTSAKVNVIVRESAQPTPPVIAEARTGLYQLLLVGAESRAVQHRLSVGYDVERIVQEAPCTVMVVVPKIAS